MAYARLLILSDDKKFARTARVDTTWLGAIQESSSLSFLFDTTTSLGAPSLFSCWPKKSRVVWKQPLFLEVLHTSFEVDCDCFL